MFSSDKKIKYSFPYLDLSGYNEVEASFRQMELCEQYDKISKSFQDLKTAVTKSIEARNVKVTEILNSVSEFKSLKLIQFSPL